METYTNESLQSINKKDMIPIVLSLQNKLNQANNKVLEEIRDDDLNNTCRPVILHVHMIIWAVSIFLIFTRPIPLALCHEHWALGCLQLHSIVIVYCVMQSTPNP